MKYMEVELKQGTFRQDPATKTAVFIPSREDSLERLQEEDKAEFTSTVPSPEEVTVHNDELDRLHKARIMLLPDEQALVKALFDDGLSEREYAQMLGISQRAVREQIQPHCHRRGDHQQADEIPDAHSCPCRRGAGDVPQLHHSALEAENAGRPPGIFISSHSYRERR